MNQKKATNRQKHLDEQERVKHFKHMRHTLSDDEVLDREELGNDVYDFCTRHMKHKGGKE